MSHIPRPPHKYVPGQTARHPEDWFDPLKTDAARLERSTAMRAGLIYFDEGYYWECHEVLEAVWMACPDPSPERDMVQAIIQLANARLKLVMDKQNAASRLCDIVADLLARIPAAAYPLRQDPARWHAMMGDTRGACNPF